MCDLYILTSHVISTTQFTSAHMDQIMTWLMFSITWFIQQIYNTKFPLTSSTSFMMLHNNKINNVICKLWESNSHMNINAYDNVNRLIHQQWYMIYMIPLWFDHRKILLDCMNTLTKEEWNDRRGNCLSKNFENGSDF